MDTISAVSNWRLVIRREGAGVTILHAVTCDETAALPEELFGLPVTALGPRALAVNRSAPPGEEVLLTCGRPGGTWSNAELRELRLPASLKRIGDYAFLGCGKLKKLTLHDGIAFWGGSAFMNCRLLDTFHLTRTAGEQGESLFYIADELSRELDVTLAFPGGAEARILFPEYIELFEENVPNHHFDYTIYGAGYPYHRCFQGKKFQLLEYDLLWPRFLQVEHSGRTALRMAWLRLRDSLDLTDQAAEGYRKYLSDHAEEALRYLLEEGDAPGVAFLLGEVRPGREALAAACAAARELGAAEALALLLEEQHRRFPAARSRRFEL